MDFKKGDRVQTIGDLVVERDHYWSYSWAFRRPGASGFVLNKDGNSYYVKHDVDDTTGFYKQHELRLASVGDTSAKDSPNNSSLTPVERLALTLSFLHTQEVDAHVVVRRRAKEDVFSVSVSCAKREHNTKMEALSVDAAAEEILRDLSPEIERKIQKASDAKRLAQEEFDFYTKALKMAKGET